MGWGKIDDMFDEHPKVLAILDEEEPVDAFAAITLWTLCFTWAQRNTRRRGKTPGLLPSGLPRRQIGQYGRTAAAILVKHGLWDEAPDGGWMIHDFADYLPTAETRAARSEAGKRGAEARWGKRQQPDGNLPSQNGNRPSEDGNLPSPSQTGDSKPDGKRVANDGSRARARRVTTSSSSEGLPIPIPTPVPPSAGAASPTPAPEGLTEGQRAKRITDAYAAKVAMCNWPAVNGVVRKAIRSGKFTDEEIEAAMMRLADDGRSATVDTLRIELAGFTPRKRAPTVYRNPQNQDDYDDWTTKR